MRPHAILAAHLPLALLLTRAGRRGLTSRLPTGRRGGGGVRFPGRGGAIKSRATPRPRRSPDVNRTHTANPRESRASSPPQAARQAADVRQDHRSIGPPTCRPNRVEAILKSLRRPFQWHRNHTLRKGSGHARRDFPSWQGRSGRGGPGAHTFTMYHGEGVLTRGAGGPRRCTHVHHVPRGGAC